MFSADSASIHQGTLVTPLLLQTLLIAWARRTHVLAYVLLGGLQTGWFLWVWISPSTTPATGAPQFGAMMLATISIGALLWIGSRLTPGRAPGNEAPA